MSIKVRYATIDDVNMLADIHSKSLQSAFKGIVSDEVLHNSFSYARRRKGFHRELSINNPENMIAFIENHPFGLLTFGDSRYTQGEEDTIELWRIYLIPQYWGMGYAKEMLDWGINEIKALGYKRIILWVLEENVRARKFYEKYGFYHEGKKIIDSSTNLNELLYVKHL